MELESIRVADVVPATPDRIYEAWLDEARHAAITGGKATIDPKVGGRFTAWDDYIEGVTEELDPGRKIVQRWRSTDFPVDAADSRVVITFAPDRRGSLVTIEHTEIPPGQGQSYEQGWAQYYFEPMKKYFASTTKPATKKAPAKKAASSKKAVAKKAAPAKKAVAKKAVAKKAAPAKKAVAKKAAPVAKKPAAPKKAPAKKAVAKKPSARR